MTALLLAALSAILYGAGVAFEHRQAARTPAESAGRPRLLALLVRQPLWLAGAALEAGGFAAHTAALRTGSLAAVQLVLSCSLLVSIALTSKMARRPPPRRCWLAIVAVVTAVGAGVTVLGPNEHGAAHASGSVVLAAVATGLATLALAAAGSLAAARRARPLLLAAAAGMADACVAVLTMAFARTFTHGLGALLTSWPLYALIAGGLASLMLTQTAYQADLPLITLPVITAVMPLASVAIGILALHETAHVSGIRGLGVSACAVAAVAALAILARTAADTIGSATPPRRDIPSRVGGCARSDTTAATSRPWIADREAGQNSVRMGPCSTWWSSGTCPGRSRSTNEPPHTGGCCPRGWSTSAAGCPPTAAWTGASSSWRPATRPCSTSGSRAGATWSASRYTR